MRIRLPWWVVLGAAGAFLSLSFQRVIAQQKTGGPDVGQQGEFQGEHVDTGAAALDSGPEAAEPGEALESAELGENGETLKTEDSTLKSRVTKPSSGNLSVKGSRSGWSDPDVDLEGEFDFQEISGLDTPQLR